MTTQESTSVATPSQEKTQSNNAALEIYLNYYIKLSNPGYATLITGDWGAGKSYLIKRIISSSNRFYVSLFGMTSTEEIYASVFAAMHPNKAKVKKATTIFDGAGLSTPAGGLELGGLVSGLASAFIKEKVDSSKVIVFDDLERCQIDITDLLGVINKYVEHHGCRVIVIAHDEKLKNGFASAKEKLFGQTLTVAPDFRAAYEEFTKKNYRYAKILPIFQQRKQEILEIVFESGLQSLRVLKHLLEDLSRIYQSLSELLLKNDEAVSAITKIYTAFSIPARLGNLSIEDLRTRANAETAYYLSTHSKSTSTNVKPALVSLADRHPSVNLSDRILSDALLEEMLFKGIFSASSIQGWLLQSRYYTPPEKMVSWRAFMELDALDHESAQRVVDAINNDFKNGSIKNRSEILHLFAIQLLLSEQNINNLTIEDTIQKCKEYLGRLTKSQELEGAPKHLHRHSRSHRTHGGYAYWIADGCKAAFDELEEYLEECEENALRASYPELSRKLLSILTENTNQFVDMLSHSGFEGTSYATIPILPSIQPEEFVKCFSHLEPSLWWPVSSALKSRYAGRALRGELREELPWIERTMAEFRKLQTSSTPLVGFRLQRTIPWAITGLIKDAQVE